jgi:serine protease Do
MPRRLNLPLALVALVVGVGLGWGLDRLLPGRPLAAQSAPTPGPAPAATASADPYDQLARQYEQFQAIDRTFALVARVVSPTVVHVVSRKNGVREDGTPARFEETGSGVITRADSDGGKARYVLTNNHVVDGATAADISLYLQDGRVLKPVQVWNEPKVDVAVLKLEGTDLPAARLGDSDQAMVGICVMAVGSPFGLTHSVSQGIISARGRYEAELEEDGVENQDFLQTDAAINPGNSGGPLVNMKGEVIGINTAIASNGGGSEGVGFSIPINLARWAMNQLVTVGRVSRGAIGVQLQELSARDAQEIGLERPRGARVGSVQTGSPAEAAGMAAGDVVLKFNGTDVTDYNHLINLVSTTPIGQKATLDIWRDRKAVRVEVAVADRAVLVRPATGGDLARTGPGGYLKRPRGSEPPSPPRAPRSDVPGLETVAVDGPASARRLGLSDNVRGVYIAKVEPGHALVGVLHPRDLIQAVDGHPLRNPADLGRILSGHGQHSFQILRTENGTSQTHIVELKLP